MVKLYRPLYLAGPTASGKSALAERLSEDYPLELVSVDSALIYRGMDLGSAKPDRDTVLRCHYHLIDIVDPETRYSAAAFVADARAAISAIQQRGRMPLLVGGTMLYFRALLHGLSDMPQVDPTLRASLLKEIETRGLPALHAELTEVDPLAASRIHAHDPQRTLRALEIFRQTGIPLSQFQTTWQHESRGQRAGRQDPPEEDNAGCFALYPEPREQLHARIALRFEQMLSLGFIEEVRTLMQRPELTADHPAMRAVGYRQMWQHLSGVLNFEQMRETSLAATRQLAKRQFTWIRGESAWQRLNGSEEENLAVLRKAITTELARGC